MLKNTKQNHLSMTLKVLLAVVMDVPPAFAEPSSTVLSCDAGTIRQLANNNDATSFNQDLSKWCVSQFQQKPDGFDINIPAWEEKNKPRWGSCPRGEDGLTPWTRWLRSMGFEVERNK